MRLLCRLVPVFTPTAPDLLRSWMNSHAFVGLMRLFFFFFSFQIDSAGLLLLFPVNACRIDLFMSPSPQICSILLCQALPRRKADPPKQGCSISGEDSSNRQPPPPEAGCTK